jgi:aconitate hydratase
MKEQFIDEIHLNSGTKKFYSLEKAQEKYGSLENLPVSLKIILEGMLRNLDGIKIQEEDIKNLVAYDAKNPQQGEVPYSPARVVLQDFTGVPLFVDLAAMRDAAKKVGIDPNEINPLVPLDLVIDHSIQVDSFGASDSALQNEKLELERNNERFKFLKWAQQAFNQTRIVPPGFGIIHQVNMEHLASVCIERNGELLFDTCVGTDSHTTMIDGLGVFGFGVGGLEAEAAMLGQPVTIPTPEVIGIKLNGSLNAAVTATDAALYVTEFLRQIGVVGTLVEFYGEGCNSLTLEERATISNMCPEYGATVGMFPVDEEVLAYLKRTGRSADEIEKVEKYFKAQGVWGLDRNQNSFTKHFEINLSDIEASIAGPRRPQDRIDFFDMKNKFAEAMKRPMSSHGLEIKDDASNHGDILIAAITSCTNTSNPAVIVAAGLVAQKAVAKGLSVNTKVKTSLAPGSQAVREYLERANLLEPLAKLGFTIVGYGCTTCIGNSGPLSPAAMQDIEANPEKIYASVLSGNRNFDGRISPYIKANFLMSPPLVVAMAIKGNMNWDAKTEAIGKDTQGNDVMLSDIWPSKEEIMQVISQTMDPLMYENIYAKVSQGTELWNSIEAPVGDLYEWDSENTYIQKPPYFDDFNLNMNKIDAIQNAKVLLKLGDSITTDHISPAGSIAKDSDAATYLREQGVVDKDFNSYGSRRGNDRVMTRGTFANVRLNNLLVPGSSGPRTKYFSDTSAQEMSIFEASLKYKASNTPCVVFAGKLFGNGSSRDWAAKGQNLLNVKAVIAESFERIHRSNLIGMGILPIEVQGKVLDDNQLEACEDFEILGLEENIKPYQNVTIRAHKKDDTQVDIQARILLQTPIEVEYYKNGGILQYTLRQIARLKPAL